MNAGVNAADMAVSEIVKLTIDGAEVVLKLSGAAAERVAAGLVAAIKLAGNIERTGKQTDLKKLMKDGPTTCMSIRYKDLEKFVQAAGRYGITYDAITDADILNGVTSPEANSIVDLFVPARQAANLDKLLAHLGIGDIDIVDTEVIEEKKTEKKREDMTPSEVIMSLFDEKEVEMEDPEELWTEQKAEKTPSVENLHSPDLGHNISVAAGIGEENTKQSLSAEKPQSPELSNNINLEVDDEIRKKRERLQQRLQESPIKREGESVRKKLEAAKESVKEIEIVKELAEKLSMNMEVEQ